LRLADGWLLAWLAPLYLLWAAAWLLRPWWERRRGRSAAAALTFPALDAVRRAGGGRRAWTRRALESLRLLAVALLVLALARPQEGHKLAEVATEGVDIVLVVDASGSMQALDLDTERPIAERRHRLDLAKAVVEDFVAGRESDAIGLVVFGGAAYTQCPLTLDRALVESLVRRIEVGVAGDATALGSALATAAQRLRSSRAKSKVIVVLTDGRSNAGNLSPLAAARAAAAFGIKIHAIGLGSGGRAPFLLPTPFGRRVVYEDVEIDEPTLRQVAAATGGLYFRATDAGGLAAVYDEIDRLEKTEIRAGSHVEYDERYAGLLAPALLLLLVEVGALGTRWRRLP
jgi:Ca-activated chloride channel family protein